MSYGYRLLLLLAVSLLLAACGSNRTGGGDTSDTLDVSDTGDIGDIGDTDLIMCAAGEEDCSGVCVDTMVDTANCGGCGVTCQGGEVCNSATCEPDCPAGQTACAGVCVDTQSDATNCGTCGTACAVDQVCNMGSCDAACDPGLTLCGMDCVDLQSSTDHCGMCATACTAGPNTTPTCTAGSCLGVCVAGFEDCDMDATNGCEADLADPSTCGGCGMACDNVTNATSTCDMGTCGFTCDGTFDNCDMDPTTGCITDLSNDPAHCGACGTVCNSNEICQMGTCTCDGMVLDVISRIPDINGVDVLATAAVEIAFGCDVVAPTTELVAVGNFTGPIAGTLSQSTPNAHTFTPTLPLLAGERVQVTSTAAVTAPGGAVVAGPSVWEFRAAATAGSATFVDSMQTLGSGDNVGIALGDIDGDRDLDVVIASFGGPNLVFVNNGMGVFTNSGQALGTFPTVGVTLVDVDGDGDLDLYCGNQAPDILYLNDGTGVFTATTQVLPTGNSGYAAVGDVDGDGDIDIVVPVDLGASVLLLNDGNGGFTTVSIAADAWESHLVDMDGDADLDLLFTQLDVPTTVWLNDGTGNFTDSGQALPILLGAALGDVDGDGDADLVGQGVTTAGVLMLNDGSANFVDSMQVLDPPDGPVQWPVALEDLDADGDLDIYFSNNISPDVVYRNDGMGVFTASMTTQATGSTYGLAFGDIDGDGDLDGVFSNFTLESNPVWINQ